MIELQDSLPLSRKRQPSKASGKTFRVLLVQFGAFVFSLIKCWLFIKLFCNYHAWDYVVWTGNCSSPQALISILQGGQFYKFPLCPNTPLLLYEPPRHHFCSVSPIRLHSDTIYFLQCSLRSQTLRSGLISLIASCGGSGVLFFFHSTDLLSE